MINFIRQFIHSLRMNKLLNRADANSNQDISAYEDLDLADNLPLDSIDLIIAINENSVIPAKNLALKNNCPTIVDLSQSPTSMHYENARFQSALAGADLIFSANRTLAAKLEANLNRHIIISRHLTEQVTNNKYIDLKKVFHLIDDTQIIIFDATAREFSTDNLTFIASILSQLPRYIHAIITGGHAENTFFDQHKSIFEQQNCASRIHFYTENLVAIKYPIDYSNIDLALLLTPESEHTPGQYYKYLHKEIAIFASPFADSNQLVTSAKIGQIFDDQNANQWSAAILAFLNASQTKRDEYKDNLSIQKQHINWRVNHR